MQKNPVQRGVPTVIQRPETATPVREVIIMPAGNASPVLQSPSATEHALTAWGTKIMFLVKAQNATRDTGTNMELANAAITALITAHNATA